MSMSSNQNKSETILGIMRHYERVIVLELSRGGKCKRVYELVEKRRKEKKNENNSG